MTKGQILVQRSRCDEYMDENRRIISTCKSVSRRNDFLDIFQLVLSNYRQFPESEVDEMEKLRKRVAMLESRLFPKRALSKGKRIYEELRASLEQTYFDKYVAIDEEARKVVGVGDDPLEAYEEARANVPNKKQFYFKRVGRDYDERIG